MGSDGLLRVGGRLGDRMSSSQPIILPREKTVVNKLMFKFHADNGHAGAMTVHHLCRRQYWVRQLAHLSQIAFNVSEVFDLQSLN